METCMGRLWDAASVGPWCSGLGFPWGRWVVGSGGNLSSLPPPRLPSSSLERPRVCLAFPPGRVSGALPRRLNMSSAWRGWEGRAWVGRVSEVSYKGDSSILGPDLLTAL